MELFGSFTSLDVPFLTYTTVSRTRDDNRDKLIVVNGAFRYVHLSGCVIHFYTCGVHAQTSLDVPFLTYLAVSRMGDDRQGQGHRGEWSLETVTVDARCVGLP